MDGYDQIVLNNWLNDGKLQDQLLQNIQMCGGSKHVFKTINVPKNLYVLKNIYKKPTC